MSIHFIPCIFRIYSTKLYKRACIMKLYSFSSGQPAGLQFINFLLKKALLLWQILNLHGIIFTFYLCFQRPAAKGRDLGLV